MNAVLKPIPANEGSLDARRVRRIFAATTTMTAAQEDDARRRAARMLEESALKWPAEFRR